MNFSKVLHWLDELRRPGECRRPRQTATALPAIESLERRFCLGTVAAAALSEWTHAGATPLAEEMVLRSPQVVDDAAAEDPPALQRAETIDVAARTESPRTLVAPPASVPDAASEAPALLSPALASVLATEPQAIEDSSAAYEPLTAAQWTVSGGAALAMADGDAGAAPESSLAVDYALTSNGADDGGAHQMLMSMSEDAQAEQLAASQSADIIFAGPQISAADVEILLCRAAAATPSEDAIIAVVDRNGRILGVRVEAGVLAAIPDMDTLVFAIDGAVAKARTAAMFSSNEAPLTSRTVRFISQTTITQREVESNPNVDGGSLAEALASTVRGPGFVAPVGVGGHFPPEIINTPLVDLFGIEHTNRDSTWHPGPDGIRGTADDFFLRTSPGDTGRFNIDPAFVPAGQELFAPESYGAMQNSGLLETAQSRGIATLPGGIPLYTDGNGDGFGDTLVGGIGVFFPGVDGYASFEQNFIPGIGQTEFERTNAPKVLEAEYIAFAAAGGSKTLAEMGLDADHFAPLDAMCGDVPFDLPFGRIDLVGITLEIIGPQAGECGGVMTVLDVGMQLGPGMDNGVDMPVAPGGVLYRDGLEVPDGYLVTPHDATDGSGLTAAQVQDIIEQGIAAAKVTRAAIRLPVGQRTKMVFAVTDTNGEILGLYRMKDATTFSIDVAVAKARNVAYYADANDLQAIDQVPGIAAGTAFTNRTFRFLAQPRFPSGIDGTPPPDFSQLNDDTINNLTAENEGAPAPVGDFTSVFGHDAFFPMTNFRDPGDAGVVPHPLANQNGVVFFPGSTPLYVNGQLVGGFGVSGDGVDQDDVVTFLGAQGYLPDSSIVRADQVFYRNVRLPYQKFLRNPFG